MKSLNTVKLSMLDLVAVREGGTVADALNIAVRTAQYDLRDLVARGLLTKTGRGPASRYMLVR